MLKTIDHFIAGRRMRGGLHSRTKLSPVSGNPVWTLTEADERLADQAVHSAQTAFDQTWSDFSAVDRAKVLRAIADGIEANAEALADAEIEDTGKPLRLAQMEIGRVSDNFRTFAKVVEDYRGPEKAVSTNGVVTRHRVERVPKGVIAAIGPWNVPLVTMSWKIAPALAWGNCVVAKPSQETPSSCLLLAEIAHHAGLPAGVLNVVQGGARHLTAHPRVQAISLTGSTDTGRRVMQAAADRLADVALELGGKNPALIFADADFDAAVSGTLQSVFRNSGQICLETERIYVERPIFKRFVEALRDGVAQFRLGDPFDPSTTHGPIISHDHRDKVLAAYHTASGEGAQVVIGGGVPGMPPSLSAGSWIEPTLWTGLPEGASTLTEEIFGPCAHIAPFDSEEQVVAQCRDDRYGLASVIWTRDQSRAAAVSRRMRTGMVWVNTWLERDLEFPFGGMRQSGVGREGGLHSIDFHTDARYIIEKF